MKKEILMIVSILAFAQVAKSQQDAQYSQYMFNGIYINPAYAGYKGETNLHSFYRNQWTGTKGSPTSMSVALDLITNNENVGLAVQMASDKLGAQSNLSAYANYAYRLKTNADGTARLAFGLGIGVLQTGLNGNLLDPLDNGDMAIPIGTERHLSPDARAGVFYSDQKFYAGFSVDNLIARYMLKDRNMSINFPIPKPHFYLTVGMLLPLDEKIQFKPSFLLKDDRGGPTSLDLNAFVLLADKIWLGGSYRTAIKLYDKNHLQQDLAKKNSIVAMTEIYATPLIRIGYAFDYSLNKLNGYGGGTHEISIGYTINRKNLRMLTPRYF